MMTPPDTPDYAVNLARYTAAVAYAALGLQAAREMFGKSYFALGVQEKLLVDNATAGMVMANYQALSPEAFAAPPSAPTSPVGFGGLAPAPPTPRSTNP